MALCPLNGAAYELCARFDGSPVTEHPKVDSQRMPGLAQNDSNDPSRNPGAEVYNGRYPAW